MEQKTRQKIMAMISNTEETNDSFDWDKAMKLIVQLVCEVEALESNLKKERETFAVAYADAQETIARLSADLYQYLGANAQTGGNFNVKS